MFVITYLFLSLRRFTVLDQTDVSDIKCEKCAKV
jgi:hypothetical protein